MSQGTIALCPHGGCGFVCCTFMQGNYIVLYPGELDAAARAGASSDHLTITDPDDHGGRRAICTAADTATCDHGYKPLDCQSYPYFPVAGDGARLGLIRGAKCPLPDPAIRDHAGWVRRAWTMLLVQHPEVAAWLAAVTLVGYRPVEEG